MKYTIHNGVTPDEIWHKHRRESVTHEVFQIFSSLSIGQAAFFEFEEDKFKGLIHMGQWLSSKMHLYKIANPEISMHYRTDRHDNGIWVFKYKRTTVNFGRWHHEPMVKKDTEKPRLRAGPEMRMLSWMNQHGRQITAMQYNHLPADLRGKMVALPILESLTRKGLVYVAAKNKSGEPKHWRIK